MIKHHLSEAEWDICKDLKTEKGFSLQYAITSGARLPHCKIGIVNDGAESLKLFKTIYDKVIEAYHSFKPEDKHVSNMKAEEITASKLSAKEISK